MTKRIAVWTLVGVIVACGWALLASMPGHWVNADSTLVVLTAPIALLGRRMPISYQWSIFFNAVTYALYGFTFELLRRGFRSTASARITTRAQRIRR